MDRAEIQTLVERVLARVAAGEQPRTNQAPQNPHGVYKTVTEAVAAAHVAQRTLINMPLEKRREIIANIRRRAAEDVYNLASMAHEETGLGRTEDKVKKNLLVIHKTPGPEILEPTAWTGDGGLTLMERAPYGVIGSITPCTNPTETILCNGIGMVSGGNTVVFNTHPAAKQTSAYVIDLINRASIEVGGPDNLMCCVETPTIASAGELMKFPGLRLIVVTGGGAVVQAAMNSGKKAICAGPGNPPVVVDETADIAHAGRCIVAGASFDNNVICTDEKEVFVVDKVAGRLIESMTNSGAVLIRNHQIRRLEKLILTADREHINRDWVGQDAGKMLREIDVPFTGDPRLVICEVPFEHPFIQLEKLMPVIGITRVRDVHEGIDLAKEAEHGYGHTASMYSKNLDALHRMARVMDVSIFIKNASNFAGLGFGGEGFTSFTIASPTGEGLTTARDFTRVRRCTLAGYFRIV
ncbi:MAG: aldehyde dehydrogenase EutE [Proteobacteria bacterium]|nr:aldehyde dehydrogenase EutE [Pseudomonadota bacterium]MCP4917870.1 aldehyde dehydrogenase EutE [Pseudomonadota bacterium]